MDRGRGGTRELLVDDRLDEAGEVRPGPPADADRPGCTDQVGEYPVAGREELRRGGVRDPLGLGFGAGAHLKATPATRPGRPRRQRVPRKPGSRTVARVLMV